MHSLDDLGVGRVCAELVVDVDAFDQKDLTVELYLAGGFADQLSPACIYPARFQRAPEGSRQSATGSGDHIVEGGRIGGKVVGRHTVVSRYLGVHAKGDGFVPARQLRLAQGTATTEHAHS
jgi:hypothetical protein